MAHIKNAIIIQEELSKNNSSISSGSKFGIGSSLADITPLENNPGPGAGGCQSACHFPPILCGSGGNVCVGSGCGASTVLKVK